MFKRFLEADGDLVAAGCGIQDPDGITVTVLLNRQADRATVGCEHGKAEGDARDTASPHDRPRLEIDESQVVFRALTRRHQKGAPRLASVGDIAPEEALPDLLRLRSFRRHEPRSRGAVPQ
jgi:hypothetical protein